MSERFDVIDADAGDSTKDRYSSDSTDDNTEIFSAQLDHRMLTTDIGTSLNGQCKVMLKQYQRLSNAERLSFDQAIISVNDLVISESYKLDQVLEKLKQKSTGSNQDTGTKNYVDDRSMTKKSYEVSHVQPAVIRIIKKAIEFLPETRSCYVFKGMPMHANISGQVIYDDQARVYCPIHGIPDIAVKHVQDKEHQATSVFAEVKPDDLLFEGHSGIVKSVQQAAAYGVMQILRQFPHLSDDQVQQMFGHEDDEDIERCVFVPLMSHKTLYIVKVDYARALLSGTFTAIYFGPFTEDTRSDGLCYSQVLCRWLLWAADTLRQLHINKSQLMESCASNCWISVAQYKQAIAKASKPYPEDIVRRTVSKLHAKPSFYNPMYYNPGVGYIRVERSFWCGNGNSVVNSLIQPWLDSQGWASIRRIQVVPDFGQNLAEDPPTDKSEFVAMVSGICHQLKLLHQVNVCHLDLRLENVCWTQKAAARIRLIDFDFVRDFDEDVPVPQNSLYGFPEKVVTENSDVWTIGMDIIRLVYFLGNDRSRFAAVMKDFRVKAMSKSQVSEIFVAEVLRNHIPEFEGMSLKFDLTKQQLVRLLSMCFQPTRYRCQLQDLLKFVMQL